MSHSRDIIEPATQEGEQKPSFVERTAKTSAKIAVAAGLSAGPLYVADRLADRAQLGISSPKVKASSPSSIGMAAMSLVSKHASPVRFCFYNWTGKHAVIENKPTIQSAFDNTLSSDSGGAALVGSGLTVLGMSTVDGVATHRLSYNKTLANADKKSDLTFRDHFRLAGYSGLGGRIAKNTAAFGAMTLLAPCYTDIIEGACTGMAPDLDQAKRDTVSSLGGKILAAVTAAPIYNACEVASKTKMTRKDAPSYLGIVKEQGAAGLMRGIRPNAAFLGLSLFVIPKAVNLADNLVSGMFERPITPSSDVLEPSVPVQQPVVAPKVTRTANPTLIGRLQHRLFPAGHKPIPGMSAKDRDRLLTPSANDRFIRMARTHR